MIRIFHIRLKWIRRIGLLAIAVLMWVIWRVESPSTLTHPPAAEETGAPPDTVLAAANTPHGPIALNRAVVCLDIHDGRPLLIKSAFSRRVDYLYCYSVLTAAKGPVTVIHRWKKDQQVEFEKKMTVHGRRMAVWSRRQLYMKQSGAWSVEIVTEGGIILGTIPFTLI